MNKLFTTLLFSSLLGVQVARADTTGIFDITLTFYEPVYGGNSNTVFNGSFNYDFTTSSLSNLTGTMNEAMLGPKALLPHELQYDSPSSSDGSGGLIISAFMFNTTPLVSTNTNGNANVTIDVSAAQLAETVGAGLGLATSLFNNLSYADCSAGGLMGTACMTGLVGGGTMGGTPTSEIVTLMSKSSPAAVPVPAAFWLFGSAFAGLIGFNRRNQMLA